MHPLEAAHLARPKFCIDFGFGSAYTALEQEMLKCRVSFTDSEGMPHAVYVPAATLFEAAALGIAEFRRSGFMQTGSDHTIVAVEALSSVRHVTPQSLFVWLEHAGKNPSERAAKVRLQKILSAI